MTTITPPLNGVAIGWVDINGRRTKVEIDHEYLKFFFTLFRRAGGTSAPGLQEITASLDELDDFAEAAAQAPIDGSSATLTETVKQLDWLDQSPAEALLRAEIDQLRARIEGLEQKWP